MPCRFPKLASAIKKREKLHGETIGDDLFANIAAELSSLQDGSLEAKKKHVEKLGKEQAGLRRAEKRSKR